MNETTNITVDEYRRLRKADAKLNLLEAGGVDDWEWYGASLHEGDVTLAQMEAEINKEIEQLLGIN